MQAQYYSLPFHHQPVYDGVYASQSVNYVQTDDHPGFSRGSPETYQPYDYFPARGDPSRLFECSSSPSTSAECATGHLIPGIPRQYGGGDVLQTEGITEYEFQQDWHWQTAPESLHGVIAPLAQRNHPRLDLSMIKTATRPQCENSAIVLSPSAQLPTPASMAILLNPNVSRPDAHMSFQQQQQQQQQLADDGCVPVTPETVSTRAPPLPAGTGGAEPERAESVEGASFREKKYGCTMCHKRFDRPSTLKKHLLVHTGEKAFVCDTCGRRFGVASNLNRHVRRCILKPVNVGARSSPSSPNPSNSSDHTGTTPGAQPHQCSSTGRVSAPKKDPNAPKRRRRAPSPSRWIPPSLLSFNLAPPEATRPTPVPLPPVRRNLPLEERDSWDENVASSPYHPSYWKNVLPGPGLKVDIGFGGKNVGNLNLRGNRGFNMLGQVLVFK